MDRSKYILTAGTLLVLAIGLAMVMASLIPAARPDGSGQAAREPADDLYKSPIRLAVSGDGGRLYVVCERANALMVVDTGSHQVIATVPVGRQPYDVVLSPDGRHIYVSNRWDDTVSMVDASDFNVVRTIPTGGDPHGLAFDPSGKTLYVANMHDHDVSLIGMETFTESKRLRAGMQPFDIAVGSTGQYAYVSHQVTNPVPFRKPPISEVTIIDMETQVVVDRRQLFNGNLSQGVDCSPDGQLVLVALELPKNLIPETQVYQGWMVTYALAALEAGPGGRVAFLLLDEMNQYYADPFDVAFTPDGRFAYVSSSGVDAVSVVDMAKVKALLKMDGGRIGLSDRRLEHFSRNLTLSYEYVIQRIPTEYNPKGLAVSPDGARVYVANRLSDSITVIDTRSQKVADVIDLGGPKHMTVLRRGEYLFSHAAITFQNQLSCNTCHPEHHVDGLVYDIAVDGGLGGNLVDNRTLRGLLHTEPFKWSGLNPNLERQEGPRAAQLFFRSHGFMGKDREAMVAFIESIPLPPNRIKTRSDGLTAAQQRGKAIFERTQTNDGRYIPIGMRCITCHPPPLFTDRMMHDVGTQAYFDTRGEFDTPQLNRVGESPPYLHDGRCWSLEEIWTVYNPYDLHGFANDLTKQQLNDMIEYLKSL